MSKSENEKWQGGVGHEDEHEHEHEEFFNLFVSGGDSGKNNMEFDSRLLERYRTDSDFTSRPTLRLYYFSPPALSIGFFQKDDDSSKDIVSRAKENGYEIVRRPTGGRAVLHKDEITYSVIASYKSGVFAGKLIETYKKISKFLSAFFVELGLNPDSLELNRTDSKLRKPNTAHAAQEFNCFLKASSYEITFGGKKICGNAQRRNEVSFLQHGSIYINYDPLEHINLFKANFSDDGEEYFNSITGIKNEAVKKQISFDYNFESLSKVLIKSFTESYNLKPLVCI